MVLYAVAMELILVILVELGCAIGLGLIGVGATIGQPRRRMPRLKFFRGEVFRELPGVVEAFNYDKITQLS